MAFGKMPCDNRAVGILLEYPYCSWWEVRLQDAVAIEKQDKLDGPVL